MKTVREFTYFGDRVSAGGGCEAAVTAKTRHVWLKFRECAELLYGRRFPLRLKGTVYKSYVRPAILYGREAWCLIDRWLFYKGQKDPWSEQCVEYSSKTDLMLMMGLSETIDQLDMANSFCWYGHVLRREDGHVLKRA